MSKTVTYEAQDWVLPFPHKRPNDYVPPTQHQRKYLRSLVAFYVAGVPQHTVGDILMHYWADGLIELEDDWEVMRHPIFVYQNYCEFLSLPYDTWDSDFDPVWWASQLRKIGLSG